MKGRKMEDPKEVDRWLKKFGNKRYGGRWTISDKEGRQKLSSHLKNTNGIVKTSLECHKESNAFPT